MRFYALLRESSDPQGRKKGLSRQWRQLNRFVETWPGGPHTIEHHAQIIESASQGSRHEWQEATERGIGLFRQGTIDGLLFPEVDRETRNPFISVPIMNLALRAGLPIFFAEEELELDPRNSEAIQSYTDAVAKSCSYLATMVRKCSEGRFDRANTDQKLPSNSKMFGFDIFDGRRVPNQAQAAALREAAQIALRNGRTAPAVSYLNEAGFHTTMGKPFNHATLRYLFRNRALIGETVIRFKKKTVILKHDPVLDVPTFEALHTMLEESRLRAPRAEVFYALGGIIRCGCGARFEGTKTSPGNYYYRCEKHCGEKAWRKDEFEWEVREAFSSYLRQRVDQQQYLELAQKSRDKLEQELSAVERDIAENDREWTTLLRKELAEYPDIIINEEKRRLTAARQSLLGAKAKIEGELESLPHVDPAEVEEALRELAKPWQRCDVMQRPELWSQTNLQNLKADFLQRVSVKESLEVTKNQHPLLRGYKVLCAALVPRKLTDEQARLLRDIVLKLNCRIVVKGGAVSVSGKLPLRNSRADFRAKEKTSYKSSPLPLGQGKGTKGIGLFA